MSVNPQISYGHGYLTDCNDSTGWVKTEDGQTLAAIVVSNNDVFDIEATVSAGNKVGYYSYPDEGGASNLGLSSTTYTKIFYRYKTSGSKAKIVLVFSDASTQTILDESASAVWKTGVVTITEAKTIDHVRLYANFATGHAYYDFILICIGVFTFPNVSNCEFTPPPRYAILKPPSRVADITQNLGSDSATFTCTCNLDVGDWKRTGDSVNGQVFIDIAHNSSSEAFQWLNTDMGEQFKVSLENPVFRFDDTHQLDLLLREYSRSSKSNETYVERFGLNL